MASIFIHLLLYLYFLLMVISFNCEKITGDSWSLDIVINGENAVSCYTASQFSWRLLLGSYFIHFLQFLKSVSFTADLSLFHPLQKKGKGNQYLLSMFYMPKVLGASREY